MYAIVKKHEPVRELFAEQLIAAGTITEDECQGDGRRFVGASWPSTTSASRSGWPRPRITSVSTRPASTGSTAASRPRSTPRSMPTSSRSSTRSCSPFPRASTINRKLANQLAERRKAFGPEHAGINWAHAEALAFASLLSEGIPLRLTGQDTERGTFSQRHLVLHDAKTGREHSAIQHLPGALATMELHNSPLSEMACVGFEYGYSQEAPETLVMWEAQFGDFANGAQVMIDQFITPGLAKWGVTSRLTLLLPHGYEGAGPEHSSARLERFLSAGRRGQHPRREPDYAGPVFPPAASPGAHRPAAAAGDHDAEEPPAPAGRSLACRGPGQRPLPAGAVRARSRSRRR